MCTVTVNGYLVFHLAISEELSCTIDFIRKYDNNFYHFQNKEYRNQRDHDARTFRYVSVKLSRSPPIYRPADSGVVECYDLVVLT